MNEERYLQQLSQKVYNLKELLVTYAEYFKHYHDEKVLNKYYTLEKEFLYALMRDKRYKAYGLPPVSLNQRIIIGIPLKEGALAAQQIIPQLNNLLAEVETARVKTIKSYTPHKGFDAESKEIEEFILSVRKDSITKGKRRKALEDVEPAFMVGRFEGLELYSDDILMFYGKIVTDKDSPVRLRAQLSELCELLMKKNGNFANYDDIKRKISPSKELSKQALSQAIGSLRLELKKVRALGGVFDIKNNQGNGYCLVHIQ